VGRNSPNRVPFVAAVQTTYSGQPVYICLSLPAERLLLKG